MSRSFILYFLSGIIEDGGLASLYFWEEHKMNLKPDFVLYDKKNYCGFTLL